MWIFHAAICKGRQLPYVPLLFAIGSDVLILTRSGKRLAACNSKGVISKFREQLEQFHRAFIDENVTDVDITVLRILGHVEAIGDRLEDLRM